MGMMFTLTDLMRATGGTDGTYVAVPGETYSGVRLVRVTETSGFEIAFDAISPEAPYVTEAGARAYLKTGDRVGVWTAPDGTVHIDRTVHLIGGDASLAWVLGDSFDQVAIWDWARTVAIGRTGVAL